MYQDTSALGRMNCEGLAQKKSSIPFTCESIQKVASCHLQRIRSMFVFYLVLFKNREILTPSSQKDILLRNSNIQPPPLTASLTPASLTTTRPSP